MAAAGNVLFVTADQWRGDCLGVAGHPVVTTPTLDGLAADGVWFANHWANTAPCGPSRATLYTGLYAMNHRSVLNGTPLSARHTNVALEARGLGYHPVLFGYTDTSLDPATVAPDDPRLRTYESVLPGFDPVVDFPFEALTPWIGWLADQGYQVDLDDPHAIYRGVRWGEPARYAADHSETAFVTDAFLDWLGGQDPDGGWFAHVSYLRPHPPYQVPAPYHALVDPSSVPMPVPSSAAQEAHPLHAMLRAVIPAPEKPSSMRKLRATYYGMIREVDDQLGRLLAGLDRSGQADRTLVVVTSDHGDQLGDHGLLEKFGYWDESFHVPLLVRDPTAPPDVRGARVDAFTEHVDVMPTILEWLGGEVPLSCDGRSLTPFLARPTSSPEGWRTAAHWEWDFRSPDHHSAEDLFGVPMQDCTLSVLRDHRHKYVHVAADPVPDLLFDLDDDPDQLVDLATDPARQALRADLAGALLSWRMRHADASLANTVLTARGPVSRREPR